MPAARLAAQALEANGFRFRHYEPIFVRDPGKRLATTTQLDLSMIDGDAAYRFDPSYPYVT